MAKFPSLPLFTDSVEADCHFLTDAEFGLYMRILIAMWRSPGCRIPAKAEWLERRFKRPITEIGPILNEFCDCDGNYWEQGRLTDEYNWVKKNSKRQSVRSKARWNKGKHMIQKDADAQSRTDAPHPTPPIPHQVEPKGSTTPISPMGLLWEGTYQSPDMLFDIFWHEYPDIAAKGNKQDARTLFLKLLKNGEDYVRIIEGCREYASFVRTEGQFNKHASTFLNAKKRLWDGPWEPGKGRAGNGGGSSSDAIAQGFGRALRDDGK